MSGLKEFLEEVLTAVFSSPLQLRWSNHRTAEERWAEIDRLAALPPDHDECERWYESRSDKPAQVVSEPKGSVHRLVLERRDGKPPPPMAKTCGNKWCVNPNHQKPYVHKGELNGSSKLTDAQARDVIREFDGTGRTTARLAVKHDVTPAAVDSCGRGRSWGHLREEKGGGR